MVAPASASLGTIGSLLEKLDVMLSASKDYPERTIGIPKGLKDGVYHLKVDLEEISSYLEDLSEVENPPRTAKCWMKEARELSYDIEDYIDSFARPGRSVSIKNRFVCKISHVKIARLSKNNKKKLKRRKGMANMFSEFRIRAHEAIERHKRYDLDLTTFRRRYAPVGPMLPTPPYEEGANLVIDGRTSEFINSLVNDGDEQFKVVSIVGSEGIGKTTLVRLLYNKLSGKFDYRIFLRMSRYPDIKAVLRGVLTKVHQQQTDSDCEDLDLIGEIKKLLQNKRYLLIIDDLWAASLWDVICNAFPEGSKHSRIIVTTGIQEVALSCCCYHSEYVFEMKPLDHDHSRKLFFNRFCCSESEFPEKCREVSETIVEICGGLPLSTISMASLLSTHPVILVEQWTYICDSLSYLLRKRSTSEGMRLILNLSYNNLAHHLKTCLLYLNMYPEGSTVCKDDLVNQWMVEGFIKATKGQDVKKAAENYFHELIDRRFLQPACIKNNDEVASCTVNEVVRDLVALKSTEENFIMAVDYNRKNVELSDKVHRLSLHFLDAKYAKTPANIGTSQVRSLSFFGLFKCMPSITEFKLLRVLNLQLWGHHGISELFQLKYFKVASDGCIELPDHMGGLQYLETVDIDTKVFGVPWDIIHLPCLLHLHLPFDTNLMVPTLSMSSDSSKSLGKLTNLEDLRLTYSAPAPNHLKRIIETLWSLLGRLGSLKTLALVPGSSRKNALVCGPSEVIDSSDSFTPPLVLQRFVWLPCSCAFSKLPKWMKMLGNLCILNIAVRELVKDGVDILRDLPALTDLSLYVITVPVEMIVFDKAGFSVLKYFKFRCSTLPWLKFEANAMLNLRKLKLSFNAQRVDRHGHTPISIEQLPGLKEIYLKIGGTSADAESALMAAVSNHPSNPRIDVQLVDRVYCHPEVRKRSTKEKEHTTPEEQESTKVRSVPTKGKEVEIKQEEDSTEVRSMLTKEIKHTTLKEEDSMEVRSASSKGKEHKTIKEDDSMEVRIASTKGKEHETQQEEEDSTEVRSVPTKVKELEIKQEDSTDVISASANAKDFETQQEEDSKEVRSVSTKEKDHKTLKEEDSTEVRSTSFEGKEHKTIKEEEDSKEVRSASTKGKEHDTLEEEEEYSTEVKSTSTIGKEHKTLVKEEHSTVEASEQDDDSVKDEQTDTRTSISLELSLHLPHPGHRQDNMLKSYGFHPEKRAMELREDPESILQHLLTKCAEALNEERTEEFHKLIQEARGVVSITGEPIQRLGAYLLEGLVARHENSGTNMYHALKYREPESNELVSYMKILYSTFPYFKFAYVAANGAIAEAFRNEDKIHIIDFQIAEGTQWITLIQALAARPGGPPYVLRITGIDDPKSEYACVDGLEIVGKRLKELCEQLKMPLEFTPLPVHATQVTKEMLEIRPGEAVAVNFTLHLHRIPDHSLDVSNPRNGLLRMVKSLSPKVTTLVEQELNTNTAPFFSRFMETMDYYSAMFESIDASLPRDSKQRINVEQHCLAKHIVNIIACEGKDRVERYEPLGKWKSRFTMAGFRACPLNVAVNSTIRTLLGTYSDKYTLEEQDGAMLIGWKNRKLVSTSAWQLNQTEHGSGSQG